MKTTRPKIRPFVAGLLLTAILTACVPASSPTPVDSPSSPAAETLLPRETPDPITAFGDPILLAIQDRPPDFQDDFSEASTSWIFETVPVPGRGNMEIANGVLMMSTDPGQSAYAGHPLMAFDNFVMRVDVGFLDADAQKQVNLLWRSDEAGAEVFQLRNDGSWSLLCYFAECPVFASGAESVDLSEPVAITIVSKGTEFAVYLNNIPLAYHNDIGRPPASGIRLELWVNTENEGTSAIAYDNLSIWNLDPPSPTPTPNPLVTRFAGPILTAIQDQPPDFQDDFSQSSAGWEFSSNPESARGTIEFANGAVTMNVEAGQVARSMTIEHGGMHFANFVLQVGVDLGELGTHKEAEIIWGRGHSFTLSPMDGWQLMYLGSGEPTYLSHGDAPVELSDPVTITIVAKGTEIAVYLNGIPLAYCNDTERPHEPRFTLGLWVPPSTVGSASIEYDNLSIWNLDSVFPLPTPTPNPLAAGYAGPILTAIQDRPPDFQDDFSQDSGQWQYHVYPDEARGFFEIANGVLTMSVEPGQMGSIGNDGMLFDNFVLQVDAYFEPLPSNMLSITWRGGLTHWHSIEVFSLGPHGWRLMVCNDDCTVFTSGPVPVNLSLPVTITIVSRGTEIAVCLNSIPLTYYNDLGRTPGPSIGIMLLPGGEPGDSVIGLDNLKVWDLDNLE